MAKGSVMSCEERLCPLGGWNSSKSDLTVQRFFCVGCLNESVGRGQGCTGHFQKTPYSLAS